MQKFDNGFERAINADLETLQGQDSTTRFVQ